MLKLIWVINNMKLSKLQEKLVLEMKQQRAEHSIISWALSSLNTQEQIEQMMDYLISIRDKHIPKGVVISVIDKISENDSK